MNGEGWIWLAIAVVAVIGLSFTGLMVMWAGEDGCRTCGTIGTVGLIVVGLIALCLFTDIGADILNAFLEPH